LRFKIRCNTIPEASARSLVYSPELHDLWNHVERS
jgi:hypothetical protein